MKKLSTQKRASILRCLIEGNSVLSTARIVGADKNTILKFLVEAGEACAAYQQKTLRNLPCKVIQLDEIWSFVGCREKAKATAVNQHPGDVWTWTSICAETKLAPAWRIGDRSGRTAMDFCADLSTRFSGELQITSDGHPAYKMAVASNFDMERTHFAQLVKIYGQDEKGFEVCVGSRKEPVFGRPDIALVSTSYVERHNLTIRMRNRRFTRLTNGIQQEARKPRAHDGLDHDGLQFLPEARDYQNDASGSGRGRQPRLDDGRGCRDDRQPHGSEDQRAV